MGGDGTEILYKSEVMSLLVDSEWQFLPLPANYNFDITQTVHVLSILK